MSLVTTPVVVLFNTYSAYKCLETLLETSTRLAKIKQFNRLLDSRPMSVVFNYRNYFKSSEERETPFTYGGEAETAGCCLKLAISVP